MNILVCVKRVPAPGARINITDDGQQVDTAFLGFTVSPHEECAVEAAVQLVEKHGGEVTVLTLGDVLAEEGGVATALDATAGDPVLVVGSLYLVGDLFAALGKTAASLRIYEEG